MSSKKLSVSVVIPNFNGRHLLEKQIPRVLKACKEAQIIVVDDASTDNSLAFLQTHFPQITVVAHPKNLRFAAACNTGVKASVGEIVVLLNNDVEPEANFLAPLVKWFDEPAVFAVGCAEYNGQRISGRSGGDFRRGLLVHWRAKDQTQTDTLWVSGGSAAFRKSIWLELGGMDTNFTPAYEEDRDICYRALKYGYGVHFEPKAKVTHNHETTNTKTLGRRLMQAASYKNHLLFVWKNITSANLLLRHFLWLPYRLIIDGLRAQGLPLIGFGWALTYLPAILKLRQVNASKSKVSDEAIIAQYQRV